MPYFLRDRLCGACRGLPVVEAQPLKRIWVVEYTCPNSPYKYLSKEFETENEACDWVDKFRLDFGPTWHVEINTMGKGVLK